MRYAGLGHRTVSLRTEHDPAFPQVWNEPNIMHITAPDMAVFTSELLRAVAAAYPRDAAAPLVTRAGTLSGQGGAAECNYTATLLSGIAAEGALGLVNEFTYHPYTFNPDCCAAQEAQMRSLVGSFAGAGGAPIALVQGEVGAPGEWQGDGALSPYNWTECTQSKWFSRRILGDAARQIQSSMFSMVDICYPGEGYHSGLLKTKCSDPSRPVLFARPAYGVVGRLFGLLDASWAPAGGRGSVNVTCVGLPPNQSIAAELFLGPQGAPLAAVWQDWETPQDPPGAVTAACNVTVTLAADLRAPPDAWWVVDTLTGSAWAPPAPAQVLSGGGRTRGGGGGTSAVSVTGVPVSDFVVLLGPAAVFA